MKTGESSWQTSCAIRRETESCAKLNLGVVKTKLTASEVATAAAVTMKGGGEQVNGRERETAILFGNLRGYFRRAWWRFRATSSPPLGGFLFSVVR